MLYSQSLQKQTRNFFSKGGGGRSWIRLCSISLTCIIFLSLFIYSSVTVLISSLLFEPSMTSGMSEASSNYVFQCLTPLTDSWDPPYDKYHITILTIAIQAINYPITVSNLCCLQELCLPWIVAFINPEIPSLTRISSPSFVSKCYGI